ncbi:uncharacterized protein LOC128965664 [Oppia nitens]|uniref:uncharacterized protein LOC128965664 n=1 Tax=Oppia nitens TaxID=1686743 RepID=UPI0023DBD535|nr:uncharacterized protein LOC128965664 [Oppia nitens]
MVYFHDSIDNVIHDVIFLAVSFHQYNIDSVIHDAIQDHQPRRLYIVVLPEKLRRDLRRELRTDLRREPTLLQYFQRQGYQVTLIWEHEFKNELNTDDELRQYYPLRQRYYAKMNKIGHVDIRESFYGGRTNNLFFNDDCKENEIIKYKDVCSLYPTVLSKCEYPIGHPIVLSEFSSHNINGYFGFIKCKVLPPKALYIPVLPMRLKNNKLVFALCGLCASDKIDHCSHSDRERCLIGSWYSEELKLAITKGYKIEKIYEVLHYEQRTDDIFKEYINKWLKIKTEASGWPSTCITNEDKQNYITEYRVRENVELEFDKMEKNPGLRFIAKLMLNSLWGKLAQRPNQMKTKICIQYDDYRRIITDAKYVIKGEIMPNEKNIIVNYKCIDDSYCNAGNTSIALGSMVTANARIHLYKELDKIENSSAGRVKYFDTDSVIYKHDVTKNWYDPITGDFLGDMSDEIEKDYGANAYIDSFASCGPKNYGYRVRLANGTAINKCKVKGIAITNELKAEINFDLIAKTAENYFINQIFTTTAKQLCFRTDKVHNVYTEKINKLYRAVSEKRVIVTYHPYYQTIPFGYIDEFTE